MADTNPSRPVRFAYVGCGFVAQTIHIPNFRSLKDCEFVGLAEVRQDLGKRVADRFGIRKLYRSHEEIAIDADIEAVGVSAPYALQGKIAEELVRAGKHVFMEKPMAVNAARAERIVAAQKPDARVFVAYMKRYDPGNLLLKRHLDAWRASGEAGPILFARNHGFGGNWTYAADPNVVMDRSPETPPPAPAECPEWLPSEWHNSYLGYLQQWTHNVNLLRFFLSKPGESSAPVVKTVQLDTDGMTGVVVLEINGTRCTVESAYTGYHGWEEHTQIYFKNGWLRTEAPPLMQKNVPATVELYRPAKPGQAPQLVKEFADPQWSYREEAAAFLRCVRSGEPFPSSAQDTLHDVRLFEDIYREFVAQQPK
ncbi:MAG TPA: Gfo/Idh/MocA family oxidoreductase [Tepidisphaeraceae bacterium]|nr:Gfo/Idh/MocA family oxidoreductase [Tepidisphaeraceae bacterium]